MGRQSSPATRPPLPLRYERFLDRRKMEEFIELVQEVYDDTKHEKALKLLQALGEGIAQQKTQEEIFRLDEIREIMEHPGLYPSAVVMWVMHYREIELEYEET